VTATVTTTRRLVLVAMLGFALGASHRVIEARQPAHQESVGDISIESISLSDFDSDGIVADVQIQATATATTTLRSLTLERVTLNNLRVTLPPLNRELKLVAGQPVTGIPPLRARLAFRELDSLESVRQIVRNGSVRVRGVLRGQIQLNLFQKLALLGGGAWVVTRIDRDVPVEIPGGELGRFAALTALTGAEPIWAASAPIRQAWQTMQDRVVRATDLPSISRSLVALETRFDLKSRSGDIVSMRHWSAGFAAGNGRIIAPAESIEPWIFDAGIAEAIAAREVSPVPSSVEIVLTTAAAGSPSQVFSSLHGGLRIVKKLSATTTVVSTTTRERFRVRFRGDDANAALLEVRGWTAPTVPLAERRADWQPAAIVIPRRQSDRVEPELLHTAVRFEEGRYRLRDPVDPAAFGSPIWTEDGVAGLLQEETSGAELKMVMARLK
jgi:hypothetical protein